MPRDTKVEYIPIQCEVLATTEAAVLILYNKQQIWLPRSQQEDRGENVEEGDTEVYVSKWLAEKEELT